MRPLSARVLRRAHSLRVCVPRCDDNILDRVVARFGDFAANFVGSGALKSGLSLHHERGIKLRLNDSRIEEHFGRKLQKGL
jgi:hypothetical protein